MQDFRGKVAVITGAANGIGKALALAFAREGANVALVDIVDPAPVADACVGLGVESISRQTDVTRRGDLEALAHQVISRFGKVNLICNNAGIVAFGPSTEVSEEAWDRILAVNVKGVANGIAAFVPRIRETSEGDGYVLNTASGAGLVAGGTLPLAAYIASKHAVIGLTDALRLELEASGIGVSALCPGSVATNILETAEYSPSVESLRPPTTGAPTPGREGIRRMTPDAVAALALDGIRARRPYIITHPESRQGVEQRYHAILAAYDDAESTLGLHLAGD